MASELKKDLDEWKRLIQLSTRKNVRVVMQAQIDDLTKSYDQLVAAEKAASTEKSDSTSQESPKTPQPPKVYCKKVESYAWDQSDSFVKVYATNLAGVQSLPPENVNCHFSSVGFNLIINNLDSQNYQLKISSLYDKIVPEESRIKIKTDSVLVMLKKANKLKWEGITEVERRKKDNEKLEKSSKTEDPGDSIMNMMKKMYEEGDDDMKRTIAKAWTESQEKRGAGIDP